MRVATDPRCESVQFSCKGNGKSSRRNLLFPVFPVNLYKNIPAASVIADTAMPGIAVTVAIFYDSSGPINWNYSICIVPDTFQSHFNVLNKHIED